MFISLVGWLILSSNYCKTCVIFFFFPVDYFLSWLWVTFYYFLCILILNRVLNIFTKTQLDWSKSYLSPKGAISLSGSLLELGPSWYAPRLNWFGLIVHLVWFSFKSGIGIFLWEGVGDDGKEMGDIVNNIVMFIQWQMITRINGVITL